MNDFTPRWADCPKCGDPFYKDETWKRTCLPCYLRKKRAKEERTPDFMELKSKYESGIDHRIELAHALSTEKALRRQAEHERDAARARARQLETELHNTRLTTRTTSIEPAMLKRLIQLCHPDRHGGSQAAHTATSWLLEQRT